MKNSKKIFLIEDDSSLISLLKTLLQLEGYQVKSPSLHRLNFINSLVMYQPDLILMDVFLEKINGLDVLRKIRTLDQLKDVKVIMTSGTDLGEECIHNGADSFVLKPYFPDELIIKIKDLTCEK